MLFIDHEETSDPRLNLAIEEHLLRNWATAEPLLLLYTNEPAVIVGRNQNPLAEIDPDYVKTQGIQVIRRLSGGGAVYHDGGNLNYSFISQGKQDLHNFARVTAPIIAALNELGVAAEFHGKSDIFAAGKKISGNAQYATGERMISHGTLLFDSDLEALGRALKPRLGPIESKAIQSARSQVTNIRGLLPTPMPLTDFRQALLERLVGPGAPPAVRLSAGDWAEIRRIAAERYEQWAWNYGRSPRFSLQKRGRWPAGELAVQIEVDKGVIQAIAFSGELAAGGSLAAVAERLTGVRYEAAALAEALSGVELTQPDFESLLALLY